MALPRSSAVLACSFLCVQAACRHSIGCRCSSLFILQAALACWLQLGGLWRLSLVVRAQQAQPTRAAGQQQCTQQPTSLQLQGWRLLSGTS